MYTEERPRRGGLLKEFILKLILIIIFVLLLIWLVPWPNMNALNPLKDQIFNANIQTMKEAGISYFTTERLPENVGDKTTLTLQKMLDMKLVVPFTDRNGNSCDVKKSYVSLEKQETEYLMKVNLKCGEEEDYILVHLGCYSYCTSAICEAKPNNTEKPSTPKYTCQVKNGKYYGKNSKEVDKATYEKECAVTYKCKIVDGKYWGSNSKLVDKTTYEKECTTPTTTPKYKCQKVGNQYWGANYKIVDEATYNKECVKPTPTEETHTYTCKIVNNQYWGKNGKIVDKATYEDQCLPKYSCQIVGNQYWGKDYKVVDKATYEDECLPKYSCQIVGNEYWGKDYKKVDKETYENECITKYTCQVVDGVYWGRNATIVSAATYQDECVPKEYEYQYLKTVHTSESHDATYSAWSDWTVYTLKKNETIPASTALMQVEDLGIKRVVVGKISAVYENIYEEHTEQVKISTVNKKVCEEFNYVADATTTYQVLSDWRATNEYKEGYRENIPYDTLRVRWVLQSVNYDICKETCTSHPYAIYRKYVRDVKEVTTYDNLQVTCAKVVEKPVDFYATVPVGKYYTVLKTPEQLLYGDIHQYRVKTRSLLSESYVTTTTKTYEEWSYMNNQVLLSAGYVMTGQYREIKSK